MGNCVSFKKPSKEHVVFNEFNGFRVEKCMYAESSWPFATFIMKNEEKYIAVHWNECMPVKKGVRNAQNQKIDCSTIPSFTIKSVERIPVVSRFYVTCYYKITSEDGVELRLYHPEESNLKNYDGSFCSALTIRQ